MKDTAKSPEKDDEKSAGKYIVTIGLEIHAELKTVSKMFCSCRNNPDEERPNVNICPICLGHPGTLPVLNKEAIKHVLKIGYAVKGNIADFTEWDRKNYFYPDIPKGYQISQYKYPLVSGGELAGVKLTRIHLEEDTAQSTHDTHHKSLVNFNRAGVPLMELVTEPVIHTAETAVKFAKELQLLLRYLGAGEANMEKGELRVEVNISVASEEDTETKKFGTKVEVKNLNSFKSVERAIAYEIERHTEILSNIMEDKDGCGGDKKDRIEEKDEDGKNKEKKIIGSQEIIQETRGWDEDKGKTFSQRTKEDSHDYRYFPDPDIPKLKISEIEEFDDKHITKEIPELPWEKRDRLKKEFGLTDKETEVLVESVSVGEYFEEVAKRLKLNKTLSRLAVNYILSDYLGLLKKENKDEKGKDIKTISTENFAKLLTMIENKKISSRGAKDILSIMSTNNFAGLTAEKENSDPEKIAERYGLIQKSDEGEMRKIVQQIIEANMTVVDDYKKGKISALQFLVGQGMKVTKGSANPEVLKKIIIEEIDK